MRTRSRAGSGSRLPAVVSPLMAFLTAFLALFLALTMVRPAVAQEPDPRYWRLDDIRSTFDAWETEYPDIFHQWPLGLSGEGATIPIARISDNAWQFEPQPRVVFHAAQHANECNGTGAIMMTMNTLLAGYGADPAVTARVDGLELYFIPVLNPDGHSYVFSGAPSWADWRKTLRDNNENDETDFPADGVDLNRNWDWFWGEYDQTDPASQKYKGPYAWSEPEIAALRNFVVAERPVLVIDYHSPVTISWTNYIFWPWMSQHGWGLSPDEPIARELAEEWAANTQTESGDYYHSIYAYDALPKEQCWVYGKTGSLTFVMEISQQCWWSGATVDTVAARVARGSIYLLDRTLAGPGIKGVVTDAGTGEPLQAEVQLAEMHAPEVGPRLTEFRFGQYYRLTLPGSYTVAVSQRNYVSQTRTVTVSSSGWTTADFALQPEATAVGEIDGDATQVWLRIANPVRCGQTVQLSLPSGLRPAQVELFDVSGHRVAVLGRDLAADQEHMLRLPGRLPNGVYLLRARAGGRQQVARLVLVN